MRTIALIAMTGIIAAAEQPKPTPPLKTAERMALTVLYERRAEIDKQIDVVLTESCADRGIPKDRCRLQPDGSFAALPEPPAKEVKK